MESIAALLDKSNTEKAKLHVLVISRLEQPALESISVRVQATKDEITSMVERRIKTPRAFKQSLKVLVAASSELQTEIRDSIVTKANGLFLIADLHLKSLVSITNVRDLRKRLNKLPEELDQYYEQAWARISGQEDHLKDIAYRAVSWLYQSRRQLKVEELRHALALQPEDKTFCADGLIAIEDVLEACLGLVVVEKHSHAVQLMHSTVLDYLHKQHDRLFKDVSIYRTSTCLTYLCLDDLDDQSCEFQSLEMVDLHANPGENIDRRRILSCRLLDYPFLDYAAENWGYHARDVDVDDYLTEVLAFLVSNHGLENAHLVHPQVFHPSQRRHVSNDHIFADLFPVRVAISFGLEHLACRLIGLLMEDQHKVVRDHWLKSLLEAVENGRSGVVVALLDAGVEPSPAGEIPRTILDRTFLYVEERPRTALDKSVLYRHEAISYLLMGRDPRGIITNKTLKYAVLAGNRHVLGKYLSVTAKEGSKERCKRANYLLHLAISIGRLDIVKLSLKHGAGLESEDEEGLTALGSAVARGRSSIVQYLLDSGADVSAAAYDYKSGELDGPKSILVVAATSQRIFQKRLELVSEYMLDYSIADTLDSDTEQLQKRLRTWFAQTADPLDLLKDQEFLDAIREDSDHGKIIAALLNYHANVSLHGEEGESVLHLSVISKTRIVAILQHLRLRPSQKVHVDARDHHGRTPLHWAAALCNAEAMETLLHYGASMSAMDNIGATTLHYATGSARCIRVALEHGCRVGVVASDLGTPLQFAKSLDDPKSSVIEALEKALGQQTRSNDAPPTSNQGGPSLPKADSDSLKTWLDWKRVEYESLCRLHIRRYLDGSQQQAYVAELARMDAEAKK